MVTDAGKRVSRRPLRLWAGWLAGPIAWALHLMVSYLMVPWVCATGNYWTMHALTLLTALLAIAGALAGWRQFRAARTGGPNSFGAPSVRRVRFMAIGGMSLSALSALIILVEGLPNFMLSACI